MIYIYDVYFVYYWFKCSVDCGYELYWIMFLSSWTSLFNSAFNPSSFMKDFSRIRWLFLKNEQNKGKITYPMIMWENHIENRPNQNFVSFKMLKISKIRDSSMWFFLFTFVGPTAFTKNKISHWPFNHKILIAFVVSSLGSQRTNLAPKISNSCPH